MARRTPQPAAPLVHPGGGSIRRAVARSSVNSNALSVLALASALLGLVVPRLTFLGVLGDLITGAATLTMLGASWGLIARRFGRRGVVWEAVAVAGLVILGWLAVSNMVAAFLPGGMSTGNRLLVTAALPLFCAWRLGEEPLLFDPSRRPGPGPVAVGLTCLFLAVAALTANVQSERRWLQPEGVALHVERLPVDTVIVSNRTARDGRYRILVEGAQRRIDQTVDLPAGTEGALSLARLGPGPARVSLYDAGPGAVAGAEPLRRLTVTQRGLATGASPGATPGASPSVSPSPSGSAGDGG